MGEAATEAVKGLLILEPYAADLDRVWHPFTVGELQLPNPGQKPCRQGLANVLIPYVARPLLTYAYPSSHLRASSRTDPTA